MKIFLCVKYLKKAPPIRPCARKGRPFGKGTSLSKKERLFESTFKKGRPFSERDVPFEKGTSRRGRPFKMDIPFSKGTSLWLKGRPFDSKGRLF